MPFDPNKGKHASTSPPQVAAGFGQRPVNMPHPSLPSLSARAHKPLINFIGKRILPSSLAPAHPHPAAPPEYRKTFSGIHQQTPNTARVTEQPSLLDFWDAPARFWRPKHHELQQFEIDAIQSGGASLL